MNEPVRRDDDTKLPLAATVAIGGLALFGAITLVGWVISAVVGVAKTLIAIAVIVALVAWLGGRRLDRR